MYKPKTPYHSFGNRLAVLRKALASDVPDKYLRNYYKNLSISDRDEIYQKDAKLISFYFQDCRIEGGSYFDTDKFYKEAERRIKGVVDMQTTEVVDVSSNVPVEVLSGDSSAVSAQTDKSLDIEEVMTFLIISGSYDSSSFLFSEEQEWLSIFREILKRKIINADVLSLENIDIFVDSFVSKYKEKILELIRKNNFILSRIK